ncbi:MAG: hypothetical protein KKH44_04850 [Bacteroidetes bacterium]|nr:hypothetical protein [Bacteroidota bacterium]
MKIDFSKVELVDLEGKPLANANIHKTLANALYAHTKDLDLVEKARAINKGGALELDKTEIDEIKRVINDPQTGFMAFAKDALIKFIDSIKE